MTWNEIAWNCVYALLIFAAGNVVSAWLRDMVTLTLERTPLDAIVRRLVVKLVRPVIIAFAVFAALAQLGIPMETFATMAGAATLAIGLAMKDSLSNVASGAMLLSLRPFTVGDTVQAGGIDGRVKEVGLFSTTIVAAEGDTITVQNDAVWSKPITNRSDRPTRRFAHRWTLSVDSDAAAAEALVLEVLGSDPRVLDEPAPMVPYDVDDLGIVLEGFAHVPNEHFAAARSDACRAILARFHQAGIQLATRAR